MRTSHDFLELTPLLPHLYYISLQVPDVEAVVIPVGGAGLIAGVGLAIKTLRPDGERGRAARCNTFSVVMACFSVLILLDSFCVHLLLFRSAGHWGGASVGAVANSGVSGRQARGRHCRRDTGRWVAGASSGSERLHTGQAACGQGERGGNESSRNRCELAVSALAL